MEWWFISALGGGCSKSDNVGLRNPQDQRFPVRFRGLDRVYVGPSEYSLSWSVTEWESSENLGYDALKAISGWKGGEKSW